VSQEKPVGIDITNQVIVENNGKGNIYANAFSIRVGFR